MSPPPQPDRSVRYTVPLKLGPARIDLTKALQVAAHQEDAAIKQKLADGR